MPHHRHEAGVIECITPGVSAMRHRREFILKPQRRSSWVGQLVQRWQTLCVARRLAPPPLPCLAVKLLTAAEVGNAMRPPGSLHAILCHTSRVLQQVTHPTHQLQQPINGVSPIVRVCRNGSNRGR